MCVDFLAYLYVGTMTTIYECKNTVTEGCVRGEVYFYSHITDVFVMCRVVEQDILEFIRPRGTKN